MTDADVKTDYRKGIITQNYDTAASVGWKGVDNCETKRRDNMPLVYLVGGCGRRILGNGSRAILAGRWNLSFPVESAICATLMGFSVIGV